MYNEISMNDNRQSKEITLPRELFSSMLEVYQKWEKFSDEFEDFLSASDEKFVKKMRRARKEHLVGKTRGLEDLKQELE